MSLCVCSKPKIINSEKYESDFCALCFNWMCDPCENSKCILCDNRPKTAIYTVINELKGS